MMDDWSTFLMTIASVIVGGGIAALNFWIGFKDGSRRR
jgi:hypothetical protein